VTLPVPLSMLLTAAALAGAPATALGHERDGSVRISSEPALSPAFSPDVHDYVTRCTDGAPVTVTVTAARPARASVDGGRARSGSFAVPVALTAGQGFSVRVLDRPWRSAGYFVRCLPPDFPAFAAQRSGRPQAQWFVVAPFAGAEPAGVSLDYVAIFDTDGVPVWWYRAPTRALDAKLLPDGDLAWLQYNEFDEAEMLQGGLDEHRLDGSVVRHVDTVGGGADHHELQPLPGGNYLLARYRVLRGVDLGACGGPRDGAIYDSELQEIAPGGQVVWSWRAADHLAARDVPLRWRDQCSSASPADIFHFNSAEPDADGFVLSFRQLDAVLRIDRRDGSIDWRLGGTAVPESLRPVGDPELAAGGFGGQHDARVLPDGTLTVHDNGTRASRPPRAVRYRIDRQARTATLLEDVRDDAAPKSGCCGSARRLAGGDWVTSWGGQPYVTELTPAGTAVFRLTFTQNLFSYRADPVPFGRLGASTLRRGMDVMHPRP
jgi:hypothetical protein